MQFFHMSCKKRDQHFLKVRKQKNVDSGWGYKAESLHCLKGKIKACCKVGSDESGLNSKFMSKFFEWIKLVCEGLSNQHSVGMFIV